jgi:hypothetical protein
MAMAESPSGYVFRGEDGSLYLIRDEILEACKLDGGDLDYAQDQEGDVEGFAISTSGPFTSFARVSYTTAPTFGGGELGVQKETIMCGW